SGTADGNSIVTLQKRPATTVYVGDSPSVLNDKIKWKLTAISNEQATGEWLSWTASGKLVQMTPDARIYVSAPDGTERVSLTSDDDVAYTPTACGPTDIVVFTKQENNTFSLRRLNTATGEVKQLTFGKADLAATCTPDGKWVVYLSPDADDHLQHIFKV